MSEGNVEPVIKRTSAGTKKESTLGSRSARVYFISVAIVIAASFFGSLVANSYSSVTVDVSKTVLENVIRLDGVLFGFTAAMLSIFYFKGEPHRRTLLIITVLSVTAFLSYLLSILISFVFLMTGEHSGGIFLPVTLACFGGLCSSVYIVLTTIEKDVESQKEQIKESESNHVSEGTTTAA